MRRIHLLNVLAAIFLVAGLLGSSAVIGLSSTTVVKLWVGNNVMAIGGVRQPIDSEGTKPVIVEGRTLVPIRAVIEAFDGSVAWDATARKVTVTLGENALNLWIGKSTASLNGTTLPVDAANPRVIPVIMSGRTMLPLRFVSESLGIDVQYEATTKMITLTYTVDTTPPIRQPPAAPTLIFPTNGATLADSVNLSWGTVASAESYRIEILSGGSVVHRQSGLSSPSYALPKDTLGEGTYTWRASAYNAGGWGTWSTSRSFTIQVSITLLPPSPLAPAVDAQVDSLTPTFRWTAVSGAIDYVFWLGNGSTGDDSTKLYTSAVTGIQFALPGALLEDGGTYTWSVYARNGKSIGDWSVDRHFTVKLAVLMVPPSLLKPTEDYSFLPASAGTSLTFTWSKVPEAVSYYLWVGSGLSGDDSTKVYSEETSMTARGFPASTLQAGKLYTWAIAAKNSSGTMAWSVDRHFSIVQQGGVSLGSGNPMHVLPDDYPTLTWNPYSGATDYTFRLCDYGSTTPLLQEPVYGTEYTLAAYKLTLGATYQWYVYAWSGDFLLAVSQPGGFLVTRTP